MRGYMREFVRVLRPGGVAVFNLPESFPVTEAEALAPEAWRASLTLDGAIPPLVAGRVAPLRVRVRNDSPVRWPGEAQLRVGDHWRARDGRMLVLDDARTLIESAVDPGGECEVQLNVFAPAQPGEYELEVDLVQELVGWFADRGSSTLRLPVTVAAASEGPMDQGAAAAQREPNQRGQGGSTPYFEMHAMAREQVVATLEDAGGVMLDVIETWRRGPAVPAIAYIVGRATAPAAKRSGGRVKQLGAVDAHDSGRRSRALRLMDERADLVGFALTSTLKGVGRVSTAARGALRRAMFQVLYRQSEHNRASDELIRSHEAQLEALAATVRAQLDIQGAADERFGVLERRLARIEVSSVTLARRASRAGPVDIDYLAFTERFGDTSEEVRERQRRYVPRFEGLSDVVDVGCGRGEFLGLLREAGISASGVDSDEAMVVRCREVGLDVIQGEAVRFLGGHPEESLGGIFAGHLVEHLERQEVVELVRVAFGRLRPGGVMVIETVNPMCLLTYATFYGDFTRVGPLPPLALKWLAEACGFAGVEIEYTSPSPAERKLRPLPTSGRDEAQVEAFNRGLAGANELLFGFQEYAVIARKPG